MEGTTRKSTVKNGMFKRIAVLVMALAMLVAGGTMQAFCSEEMPVGTGAVVDQSSFNIAKLYQLANAGMTSPAEKFTFKIEKNSVTDSCCSLADMPAFAQNTYTIEYSEGDATVQTQTAGATDSSRKLSENIALPNYSEVGIYTYKITETAGTTAGVEYDSQPIYLVITVTNQNSTLVRSIAMHYGSAAGSKTDTFTNTYKAGQLIVGKEVEGALGDVHKEFTMKVNFTAPAGKTVKSTISYVDGETQGTIAPANWSNGTATATISLHDGETVSFTNIPEGVTYEVVENDYTADGYEADYTYHDTSKKITGGDTDRVTVVNSKGVTIDTGITSDSTPYIFGLALAGITALLWFRRKREY